jgi:hypothetical protein
MWQRKLEKEQKIKDKQSKNELAMRRTREAMEAIEKIENILKHTLTIDDRVDWEALKDKAKFSKAKPQLPKLLDIPRPPEETDLKYQPKFGFFDKISSSKKQSKIDSAKLLFKNDYDKWMKEKEKILKYNAELEKQYQEEFKQWESEEHEFLKNQQEKNDAIEKRREQYSNKLPDAVVDYCELVLSNSEYPDYFPQEFDLDYNPTIVKNFYLCNLANIDPKLCFKSLKGVGSSKLHSLTPIAPILNISREDKRFISSYEVAKELNETCNLAAMDWEDFEHLIRELFEKEFSQSGGEVKVTRASRDHGVDAVAFDPDPIRGGKIVIQAKRYTNTVGVSSFRDLYGTVMNEGATKGILVTTADYGPDAYEFAKGKPLTLLNGSNLLHLLEKHGHKAKIDLKAAKQILSERENIMDWHFQTSS